MNSVDVIVVGTGSAGSARAIRCAKSDWRWNEGYATQPEVLRYAHHVAERFELRREIEFNTRMSQAVLDEHGQRWTVRSADGREWSAQAEGVHAFFWRRAWLPTHSRNVAADGYSGFTMTKGSVDAA